MMADEISDYTKECNTESFLESFNIDTGNQQQPKFVVNLDTLADQSASEPSADQGAESPKTPASSKAPLVPQFSPFMQIGKNKNRPRGSYKPLNEIVETRIRTYEGADSHAKVTTLAAHFPQFKRCHIDRCFTKNLLDFDKTYSELFALQKKQQEDRSKFKLILTPTSEKPNPVRIIPNIKSPELINTPSVRGRPTRSLENKYYRRVIVGKDGTVEPADISERNFVRKVDPNNMLVARQKLTIPKSISYPGMPGGEFNLNEPTSEISKAAAAKLVDDNRAVHQAVSAIKAAHPNMLRAQGQAVPGASDDKDSEGGQPAPDGDSSSKEKVVADVVTVRAPESKTPGKFFRTNRLTDAELKKRDYVAKEMQGASANITRSTRSSSAAAAAAASTITKMEPGDDDGDDTDAANFMAGVGVVSTNAPRRRGGRRGTRGRSAAHQQSEVSAPEELGEEIVPPTDADELDDFGLRRSERRSLLAFFNEAPLEELTLMSGCSQKTAEVIINLRPFNTTVDLKLRLDATRYLSTSLIDACKELMSARTTFTALLQNCEAISHQVNGRIEALLAENCTSLPTEGGDLSRNKKTGFLREQPVILHPLRQLKPYQLVGLNWLRILHEEGVNAILADEMGLGKTVQAIAFLAYLYEAGERGPHLIMCPSSTVDNWRRELQNWCSQLKVLVYQGTAEVRKAMRLKIYESSQQHQPPLTGAGDSTFNGPEFNVLLTSYSTATSSLEDRALMKRVDFKYGIFDEAHMLKNVTTQRYKTLSSFQIRRRILLTGTPLQNNLLELISLLAFVMPDLFSSGGNSDHVKRMFQLMSKQSSATATTASVAEGAGKKAMTDDAESTSGDFEPEEAVKAVSSARSRFENERIEQAKQLLQPFCLRRLKSQVLCQLPPKTEEIIRVPFTDSQRAAYASLVSELRYAQGATAADMASDIGEDEDPGSVRLAHTSLLLNRGIVAAATNGGGPKRQKKSMSDLNMSATGGLDRSGGVERLTPFNMLMQLRKAANHELLLPGISYSDDTLREISIILHNDPSHSDADPALVLTDLCLLSDHQVHKVCRLYDVLNPFALPPEALVTGSGKIKWLDDNLPCMIKEGHRILIFSQFVIVLDLLGEYLINTGHKFLRMDGSTPVQDRQTLIDTFNNDVTYEIFLLSTKAGGLGISLTGADVVILHDLDFNPYNDRQAADRCHRVGQIKPVQVIRLISEGSVEESIWKNAEEKLRLEEDVTDFDGSVAAASSAAAAASAASARVDETRRKLSGASAAPMEYDGVCETDDAVTEANEKMPSKEQQTTTTSSGKRLNQGEIFKFLSDALSYGGGFTPTTTQPQSPGLRTPRPHY